MARSRSAHSELQAAGQQVVAAIPASGSRRWSIGACEDIQQQQGIGSINGVQDGRQDHSSGQTTAAAVSHNSRGNVTGHGTPVARSNWVVPSSVVEPEDDDDCVGSKATASSQPEAGHSEEVEAAVESVRETVGGATATGVSTITQRQAYVHAEASIATDCDVSMLSALSMDDGGNESSFIHEENSIQCGPSEMMVGFSPITAGQNGPQDGQTGQSGQRGQSRHPSGSRAAATAVAIQDNNAAADGAENLNDAISLLQSSSRVSQTSAWVDAVQPSSCALSATALHTPVSPITSHAFDSLHKLDSSTQQHTAQDSCLSPCSFLNASYSEIVCQGSVEGSSMQEDSEAVAEWGAEPSAASLTPAVASDVSAAAAASGEDHSPSSLTQATPVAGMTPVQQTSQAVVMDVLGPPGTVISISEPETEDEQNQVVSTSSQPALLGQVLKPQQLLQQQADMQHHAGHVGRRSRSESGAGVLDQVGGSGLVGQPAMQGHSSTNSFGHAGSSYEDMALTQLTEVTANMKTKCVVHRHNNVSV